jgi:hypothetical protein
MGEALMPPPSIIGLFHLVFHFINTASENPVLCLPAGRQGRGRKVHLLKAEKINQMLKQVQHDMTVRFWSFCHPELVSGSRFWVLEFRF